MKPSDLLLRRFKELLHLEMISNILTRNYQITVSCKYIKQVRQMDVKMM